MNRLSKKIAHDSFLFALDISNNSPIPKHLINAFLDKPNLSSIFERLQTTSSDFIPATKERLPVEKSYLNPFLSSHKQDDFNRDTLLAKKYSTILGRPVSLPEINSIPNQSSYAHLLSRIDDLCVANSDFVNPQLLEKLRAANFLVIQPNDIHSDNSFTLQPFGTVFYISNEIMQFLRNGENLAFFIYGNFFNVLPFSYVQYLVDADQIIRDNLQKSKALHDEVNGMYSDIRNPIIQKEYDHINIKLGRSDWELVNTKSGSHVCLDGKSFCKSKAKVLKRNLKESNFAVGCDKCRTMLGLKPFNDLSEELQRIYTL